MSATNATTNYELPVFIATDKPAWLVDWNGAMNAIDSAIKEAKTAGDNAQSTANTNAQNIQTLDGTVTSQGTAIGNLQTAVSGNTGSINTINSLIGNGEPTTTDKTIIGAINEINAQVQSPEADDVSYDNTTSGLTATNVQGAIDELASGGAGSASLVSYDNTSSGLTATNVQGAIDEVNDKFGDLELKYDSVGGKPQYSTDGGSTWVNFSSALSVDEIESAVSSTADTALGSGTVTYTFLHDHDEILVVCHCAFVAQSGNAWPANFETDITATSSDFTLTLLHDAHEFYTGAIGQTGRIGALDRTTYKAEGIKAGDKITFTQATLNIPNDVVAAFDGTYYDYVLFSIN